jgi:hypothetical protein
VFIWAIFGVLLFLLYVRLGYSIGASIWKTSAGAYLSLGFAAIGAFAAFALYSSYSGRENALTLWIVQHSFAVSASLIAYVGFLIGTGLGWWNQSE